MPNDHQTGPIGVIMDGYTGQMGPISSMFQNAKWFGGVGGGGIARLRVWGLRRWFFWAPPRMIVGGFVNVFRCSRRAPLGEAVHCRLITKLTLNLKHGL